MAIYEAEAIVLGATNWGEADRIVTLFSRERGKIKAIAYGSRRTKSNLASLAQLFNVAELRIAEAAHGLEIIKNYEHQRFLADFSLDYQAFGYAAFVAELVTEFFEVGEPQPKVYDKLLEIVPVLVKRNPRIAALAAFFQLMEYTGSQLQYDKCVKCGKVITGDALLSFQEGGALCKSCSAKDAIVYPEQLRQLIDKLLQFSWQSKTVLHFSAKVLQQAEKLMLGYLYYVLNKDLKSLSFIQQILEQKKVLLLQKPVAE